MFLRYQNIARANLKAEAPLRGLGWRFIAQQILSIQAIVVICRFS